MYDAINKKNTDNVAAKEELEYNKELQLVRLVLVYSTFEPFLKSVKVT